MLPVRNFLHVPLVLLSPLLVLSTPKSSASRRGGQNSLQPPAFTHSFGCVGADQHSPCAQGVCGLMVETEI